MKEKVAWIFFVKYLVFIKSRINYFIFMKLKEMRQKIKSNKDFLCEN